MDYLSGKQTTQSENIKSGKSSKVATYNDSVFTKFCEHIIETSIARFKVKRPFRRNPSVSVL